MCEYEVVCVTDTDAAETCKDKLNELAADGYELKLADRSTHGLLLILERECKEAASHAHHKKAKAK